MDAGRLAAARAQSLRDRWPDGGLQFRAQAGVSEGTGDDLDQRGPVRAAVAAKGVAAPAAAGRGAGGAAVRSRIPRLRHPVALACSCWAWSR